jgi:hypothetical protein
MRCILLFIAVVSLGLSTLAAAPRQGWRPAAATPSPTPCPRLSPIAALTAANLGSVPPALAAQFTEPPPPPRQSVPENNPSVQALISTGMQALASGPLPCEASLPPGDILTLMLESAEAHNGFVTTQLPGHGTSSCAPAFNIVTLQAAPTEDQNFHNEMGDNGQMQTWNFVQGWVNQFPYWQAAPVSMTHGGDVVIWGNPDPAVTNEDAHIGICAEDGCADAWANESCSSGCKDSIGGKTPHWGKLPTDGWGYGTDYVIYEEQHIP